MKVRIKTAELVPDKYGFHIKITKVGIYDDNGKYIRWAKLNNELLELLCKTDLNLETTSKKP